MSHQFARTYGKSATVLFTLVDFGMTDLEPGIGALGTPLPPAFDDGDVRFVCIGTNGSTIASGSTDNLPTNLGHGVYALNLTATEMMGAWVCVRVKDQGEILKDYITGNPLTDSNGNYYWTGRKQWEDEHIVIETFGHTNAAHGFDRGSPWNGQH